MKILKPDVPVAYIELIPNLILNYIKPKEEYKGTRIIPPPRPNPLINPALND